MTADPSRPAAEPPVAAPSRIAFLGLGLIGGSIAKALRGRGVASRLIAWTPDGHDPRSALQAGVIDEAAASPAEAIRDAELVILAGPAGAVLETLADLAAARGAAGPATTGLAGATITDVASTKSRIVSAASAAGLPFVGGHPMAGREGSGFDAATAELFVGRPWVVVPAAGASPADIGRVAWLAGAVGARPIQLRPDDHDRAVAAISHLPLVVAAALVEAVAGPSGSAAPSGWPEARDLAATGWTDMTRLARGDAVMGAGILATNSAEIAARLRELRLVIDSWIGDLERQGGPDEAGLRARLSAARARLEEQAG